MALVEKIKELYSVLDTCVAEAEKLENKGNRTAGTRLRLGLQDLKAKAHELRKETLVIRDKKPPEAQA